MKIDAAIQEFLLDRQSFGRKPNTIKFYRSQLGSFADYLCEQGVVDVDGLTRSTIRTFFAHQHQRDDIRPATVAASDRAIRAFCTFCLAEGWIEQDPMDGRTRFRPPATLPDTWEIDEVRRILATCEDDPIGVRDRAVLLLLLDTGLRAGEVSHLTPASIIMYSSKGSGRVFVEAEVSKSGRDRIVPFQTETAKALGRWLAIRTYEAETLFVAFDGARQMCPEPFTEGGLYQMIRRRVKEAGVKKKRKLCHIWRHTFGRFFMVNGGDLETLRRILGHSDISTTAIYAGFRTEDIEAKHAKLTPVRLVLGETI